MLDGDDQFSVPFLSHLFFEILILSERNSSKVILIKWGQQYVSIFMNK
jgi:hypothetical protein